jgi:hypothetical protein
MSEFAPHKQKGFDATGLCPECGVKITYIAIVSPHCKKVIRKVSPGSFKKFKDI